MRCGCRRCFEPRPRSVAPQTNRAHPRPSQPRLPIVGGRTYGVHTYQVVFITWKIVDLRLDKVINMLYIEGSFGALFFFSFWVRTAFLRNFSFAITCIEISYRTFLFSFVVAITLLLFIVSIISLTFHHCHIKFKKKCFSMFLTLLCLRERKSYQRVTIEATLPLLSMSSMRQKILIIVYDLVYLVIYPMLKVIWKSNNVINRYPHKNIRRHRGKSLAVACRDESSSTVANIAALRSNSLRWPSRGWYAQSHMRSFPFSETLNTLTMNAFQDWQTPSRPILVIVSHILNFIQYCFE